MIWVSEETAPKRSSNSSSVSAISSSGTSWPSLNLRGRRISNRRNEALIGGLSLDSERNVLRRQISESGFRYDHFSACPTLEGETASQESHGATLRFGVGKANDDHDSILQYTRTNDDTGHRAQNAVRWYIPRRECTRRVGCSVAKAPRKCQYYVG